MLPRTRQYLCSVRPMGSALVLSTMRWADEIVDADAVEGLPSSPSKPREHELHMAEQLIDSLAKEFHPDEYKDD